MDAIARHPGVFGTIAPEHVRALSGLEIFERMRDGRLPAPPIAELMDFTLADFEFGRALFVAKPNARALNPLGAIHGGYAATLLDSCMGCAVHSTLKAGQAFTTLELKVNFVRALSEHTGEVSAEGKIINVGRQVATAEGRIIDARGRLLAHGTTTCLIFPLREAKGE